MNTILKEYCDNNEALDAIVESKTTYLSLEDVEILLQRQAKALSITAVI